MTRTDDAHLGPRRRAGVLLLSSLAVLTGLGAAQATTADDLPGVAAAEWTAATDRLNETLLRIGDSLEAIRLDQRALILIRRIEIAERRLEPLVTELRESRGEVRNLREEVERLGAYRESVQEGIERRIRDGADPTQIGEREELRQLDLALETIKANLERAEARVIEQENGLDRARRNVEVLDDQLRDWLENTAE